MIATDEEGSLFQLQTGRTSLLRLSKQEDQSKPDQMKWKGHLHTDLGNDCPTTKRGEEKHDGENGERST